MGRALAIYERVGASALKRHVLFFWLWFLCPLPPSLSLPVFFQELVFLLLPLSLSLSPRDDESKKHEREKGGEGEEGGGGGEEASFEKSDAHADSDATADGS